MASALAKIKIAARLRPRIEGEIDDQGIKICRGNDNSAESSKESSFGRNVDYISVPNPRDITQIFNFPFSSCYDQTSTQGEIFQNDVRPLIDVVFKGVTVTVFAYGVTSSGKTHTMQGSPEQPGVIPRTLQALFVQKDKIHTHQVSLSMSYLEIYKDECYDLLVTRENAPKLPVRENDAGKVFVANLSSEPIDTVDEFETIYSRANKHRSVGATNLNRASSRSHAVLTIEVKMLDPIENKTLVGKINLVDLAGSENNKLTGNDPSRMAESSAINKSLSVLGQVVHALNLGASRIPYRNSKLTRILQDALGGSSVGLLICNLAPGNKFRQDTLNTLNFATRTKNIENKPVINERDNRPAPKAHFAAIQPPPPKLAPAVIQPVLTTGSGAGAGPTRSRQSLAPASKRSRVPRLSSAFSAGGTGFQPMVVPGAGLHSINEKGDEAESSSNRSGSLAIAMSEKEINERISKAVEAAVEAEVARRMAEIQRQREKEDADRRARDLEWDRERERRASSEHHRSKSRSPRREQRSSESMTDNELRQRIQELEQRLERDEKELRLANVISPASKKKTGRAYVALARTHSEKGDLQVALDLYRKAETYVPDNIKLKERIMAIENSIKSSTAFVPSPRKPKRAKRTMRDEDEGDAEFADNTGADISRMPGGFGLELTNGWGISPFKAAVMAADSPVKAGSPLKRRLFEPDSPTKRLRMEPDENFPGALTF